MASGSSPKPPISPLGSSATIISVRARCAARPAVPCILTIPGVSIWGPVYYRAVVFLILLEYYYELYVVPVPAQRYGY